MRRFELGIGPLLARLGYTRPDEDPLQSGDLVYPSMVLANLPYGAASPGCRFQAATAFCTGGADLAQIYLTPPAGGCWVRRIIVDSANNFVFWGTSNDTPAHPVLVAPVATLANDVRPDNREAGAPLTILTGDSGTAPTTTLDALLYSFLDYRWDPAFWWVGTKLGFSGSVAADPLTVSIQYETPLEGMRRQIT